MFASIFRFLNTVKNAKSNSIVSISKNSNTFLAAVKNAKKYFMCFLKIVIAIFFNFSRAAKLGVAEKRLFGLWS